MKKTFGLIAAAMLLVGGVAFADEAMLIDFTLLDAGYVSDKNIDKLYEANIDFVARLPEKLKNLHKSIVESGISDLKTSNNLIEFMGRFVYVKDVLLYHRMNDLNQTAKLLKTTNARYNDEFDIFCRFWPKWIARLIMKFYSGAAKYY